MQSVQVKFWDGLQGIQGIQEASGTPSSVGLQGLKSLTAYRCQAVWLDNNTPFAESNISEFTTLPAGNITLTLHNITRQGYNYVVQYDVTNTYALSNAVLSINGGQIFQGTIQGGTITFTVSGLDAGTDYLYTVTAQDIYQESATVTGTVTTTVVNEINMYYSSRTENSVTFDLSYLHDYTFIGGWVNVWLSTQDPTQDNPITHEDWFDGDTQVKVPDLSPETTYYFQAGMTVEDGFGTQTTVYSSVITQATAEHDYSRDFFTINNEDSVANEILFQSGYNYGFKSVDVSVDGGSTWQTKTASYNGTLLGTLQAGESMLVRHTGSLGETVYHKFNATANFSVSGNITSLTEGMPKSNSTMPVKAFYYLFQGAQTLVSAENLKFDGYTNVAENGCAYMFFGCNSLTTPPALPWLSVGVSSFEGMFSGCYSLREMPELKATVLAEGCYMNMFYDCTSLAASKNLPAKKAAGKCYEQMYYGCTSLASAGKMPLTNLGERSCYRMFAGCSSLTKGVDIRAVKTIPSNSSALYGMYENCRALDEAYYPSVGYDGNFSNNWLLNVRNILGTLHARSSVANLIPTDSVNGCPTPWMIVTY